MRHATRADIQELLIDPVNALGIPRAKTVTAADHKRGLELLRTRLCYLDLGDLERLGDEVELLARTFKCWPTVCLILDTAERIRPDPLRKAKIDESVRSMMRSAPGRAALAGDGDCSDWAVEMLRAVLKKGHGWKVATFEADRWKRDALEGRLHEKRVSREVVAEADAAADEAAQAEAANLDAAAALRGHADRAAARAAAHRDRLRLWADFEARAAAMVRSAAPAETEEKDTAYDQLQK